LAPPAEAPEMRIATALQPDRRQRPDSLRAVQILTPLTAARPATEEEGGGLWMEIMPIGRWVASHLAEGVYEITAADIAELVRNFNSGVRGIEICLREGHWDDAARGWIQELRGTVSGLEARIVLNSAGQQLVDDRVYRYASPGWYDPGVPYTIATDGSRIPWVLDHVALTNNPFFVELPAVAERRDDGTVIYAAQSSTGETIVNRAQIIARLTTAGVQADRAAALADQAMAMAEADREAFVASHVPAPAPPNTATAQPPAPAPTPEASALTAENAQLRAQLAERQRTDERTAVRGRFDAVRTADGRQIAPAHAERLTNDAMEIADAAARDRYVASTIETLTRGLVLTGERGAITPHVSGGDGLSDGLHAAAVRHHLPLEFVLMASERGEGRRIDLAAARQAVSGMRMRTAAVEIPSLNYQDTMTLVRSMFLVGWESTPTFVDRFASVVTSDAREVSYNSLGSAPRMRQWTDEIQPRMLNSIGPWTVIVDDWEATLEIPLSYFSADKLGQYAARLQQMGAYARRHPDKLLIDMIVAAGSTLCYDGHYLCDNDHSEGASGTQDNLLATSGDDTVAHITTDLQAAIAAQQGFKDDLGEVLDIGWEPDAVWDVVCRPTARPLFDQLATSTDISSSTNQWKGRLRVQSSARATTANRWWLCYLNGSARPAIVQYQTGGEPSDLKELGPDSEHCKKSGNIWISTQGHYKVVPGDWRTIVMTA